MCMLQWLKNHFIPHEANGFAPYVLRMKIAMLFFALIALIELVYLANTLFVLPRSDYFAAIFATVLVDQTNKERDTAALRTLTSNPKLEIAAQLKADDMAAKGYFAHNAPDGTTPWHWFAQAGYDFAAAGENLAVNFTDSKDVTEAWMRSPTHRANIMSGNYTEIGIATARGMYKGKEAIFVVQKFGRPSIIARQLPSASSTVSTLANLLPTTVLGATTITKKPAPTITVTRPVSTPQPTPPTPVITETPKPQAPIITTLLPVTTVVAGAEALKLPIENEIVLPETAPQQAAPLGYWARIFSAPRQLVTFLFLGLGALMLIALLLNVFIRVRVQHPHLILNGLLLIAVVSSLIMLNTVIGVTQGVI